MKYCFQEMIVAFTGYNGFIASEFRRTFAFEKFDFVALQRNEPDEVWLEKLKICHVVINLAGFPVVKRWTAANRKKILESRVNTTQRLVSLLNKLKANGNDGPELLISGSAIGLYPNNGEAVDEDSIKTGDNFLSRVVISWEHEAQLLDKDRIRLVVARVGVVLGKNGGLLKKLMPLFRLGLGGKLASGEQMMSFIHIDDLVSAFAFFIAKKETHGVYNLVGPEPVNNMIFTHELAKALKRPAMFAVPAFALRLVYGNAADIMIKGENVFPTKLLAAGFNFQYGNITNALQEIVAKKL